MEAIHRGEIKALLSACFNPLVSLPDANYTREALEKLEYFGVVDFFMSETAHHADVVFPGSLQEEEEGIGCTTEGRVIHIQKAVDPPGNAKGDSWIYIELAKRLGKENRLLWHHLRKNRQEHGRVLAVSIARPPWYTAPFRRRTVIPLRR